MSLCYKSAISSIEAGTDWQLWRKHSGLPEVWDMNFKTATSFQFPLRPGRPHSLFLVGTPQLMKAAFEEFVESTWYLYRVRQSLSLLYLPFLKPFQATHDPLYLDIGERILYDITIRAKVECGLTGIRDLRDNQRDDRMESFVLSETLKVFLPSYPTFDRC